MKETSMEALRQSDLFEEPDVAHLVTEDDEPVDSVFSEKQMRLLTSTLLESWRPDRPFVALANVGLFAKAENPALVPDVMVSLGVSLPEDVFPKGNRSYMIWRYGKPPDLVIEIVSNREGGELEKAARYAEMGVSYYLIFDPEHHLGERDLRAYVRHGSRYVHLVDPSWLPELGLGVRLWNGRFEDMDACWLRPCDQEGNLYPTPAETARQAEATARESEARARESEAKARESEAKARESEAKARGAEAKAREAETEVKRLRARLRELGVEET